LTAISREAQTKAAERTPKERRSAIKERTNILRGEVEEVGIGDELERTRGPGQEKEQEPTAEELAEDVARINELEAFAGEVISKIPYFQDRKEVYDAMYLVTGQAPEDWDLGDTHLADLGDYASREADARTEGGADLDKLFS
jgi:3-methyladenine DNA glycosylase/8-oxoguanine DNA glycosylase